MKAISKMMFDQILAHKIIHHKSPFLCFYFVILQNSGQSFQRQVILRNPQVQHNNQITEKRRARVFHPFLNFPSFWSNTLEKVILSACTTSSSYLYIPKNIFIALSYLVISRYYLFCFHTQSIPNTNWPVSKDNFRSSLFLIKTVYL